MDLRTLVKNDRRESVMGHYKRMYRTVYNFHQRYAPFPDSEEKWALAAQDAVGIAKGSPFASDLLTAVYNELERCYNKERGG